MPEITLTSEITVRPVQQTGGDHMIVAAARVSTSGEAAADLGRAACAVHFPGMPEYETCERCRPFKERQKENAGLIRYLMRHRHGCYDSGTEVLTSEGWKFWPDVTGDEQFLTLDTTTDAIEWQRAERLVRKTVEEDMVRVEMAHVDLLVTWDHNMFAAPRERGEEAYRLIPAHQLFDRSHRIRMGGGRWAGDKGADPLPMRLIGFFIGDGYCTGPGQRLEFHLRKARKVDFLREVAGDADWQLPLAVGADDRYAVHVPAALGPLFSGCYSADGEKQIPAALLNRPADELADLFDGLMASDGSVSEAGRLTYHTTSKRLADQVQELAVKIGMAATLSPHDHGEGHYGDKPAWRLTIYRERNARPRVGWTDSDRRRQVTVERYSGEVHCVTVPNGTLYVRRNGTPCWCGNTPFEHGSLTFYVHAPIFVWREWHRHRIGFSYNEESARYKTLDPVFYVPPRDRPMIKVDGWKPGRPKFLTLDQEAEGGFSDGLPPGGAAEFIRSKADAKYAEIVADMREGYEQEYARYLRQLARHLDPGLARDNLPVGIYSACWVTCNPRSLMAFLSLRTHNPDPDSQFVSYPLYEIEVAARAVEQVFAAGWPLTYAAFCEFGRVAP